LQSKKGRANRVGAILDHVTQFRPDADFVSLCEALAATNQEDVVRQYLSRHGGGGGGATAGPAPADTGVTWTEYSRPGAVVDAWRTVLIQSRSAIIELLDASDEFVNRLVKYGVMNFATGELCRVYTTRASLRELQRKTGNRETGKRTAPNCRTDGTRENGLVVERRSSLNSRHT